MTESRSRLRTQQLIISTVTIVGSIFLMVAVPVILLLTVFKDLFSSNTPTVWQLVIFLLVVTVPAVLGTWLIRRVSRSFAAQTFDPLFTPLGLRPSPYLLHGRQYHGQIDGRKVDVYLSPTQRQRTFTSLPGMTVSGATYFGHVLQVYVETKSSGKMAISQLGEKLPQTPTADIPAQVINRVQDWMFTHGLKTAVAQVSKQYNVATFQPDQSEFKGFSVATMDRPWSEKVLEDQETMAPIRPLLALAPQTIMFSLQILPSCVKLATHLHKQLITSEAVKGWLTHLIQFARAVEDGPRPSVTFVETAAEHATRTNPAIYARRAIFLVIAFFILVAMGMISLIFTLYYFEKLS